MRVDARGNAKGAVACFQPKVSIGLAFGRDASCLSYLIW